jgi:methyl-accepting chemotaxis protein PixJ
MGVVRTLLGSVFMGGAIASMHYIGMSAMRLPALAHYSVTPVLLSIFLAVIISLVALVLTFHFRSNAMSWSWQKAGSALVLGSAMTVMHYTSMAAASFTPFTLSSKDVSHSLGITPIGTVGIVVVTLMVLGFTLLTTLVERRFLTQALDSCSQQAAFSRCF